MGLFEVVAFFAGTAIIGRACYLWGYSKGKCPGCAFLREIGLDTSMIPQVVEVLAEGFDQKVDIVCNACGLVAEVTCASCNPVKCDVCGSADCDWDALVATYKAKP